MNDIYFILPAGVTGGPQSTALVTCALRSPFLVVTCQGDLYLLVLMIFVIRRSILPWFSLPPPGVVSSLLTGLTLLALVCSRDNPGTESQSARQFHVCGGVWCDVIPQVTGKSHQDMHSHIFIS